MGASRGGSLGIPAQSQEILPLNIPGVTSQETSPPKISLITYSVLNGLLKYQ